MTVESTPLEGVLLVHQPTHEDHRGFFRQTYVLDEVATALGRRPTFAQANHARSAPGVLRGFHAEPWEKLVYASRGEVVTAVADCRPDSPTFGDALTVRLGDGTERPRLFVPEGVAHAYCNAGDSAADYLYEVTAAWRPEVDRLVVRWDDPTLAVAWPVDDPVLSDEDAAAPTLRAQFPDHPRFREAPT